MNKLENPSQLDVAGPSPRHKTTQVMVGNVAVGGGAPIVVQSMTNTDTADVDGTIAQVAALSRAGSEMVRITVDRDEAAAAVPHIRDGLRRPGPAGLAPCPPIPRIPTGTSSTRSSASGAGPGRRRGAPSRTRRLR